MRRELRAAPRRVFHVDGRRARPADAGKSLGRTSTVAADGRRVGPSSLKKAVANLRTDGRDLRSARSCEWCVVSAAMDARSLRPRNLSSVRRLAAWRGLPSLTASYLPQRPGRSLAATESPCRKNAATRSGTGRRGVLSVKKTDPDAPGTRGDDPSRKLGDAGAADGTQSARVLRPRRAHASWNWRTRACVLLSAPPSTRQSIATGPGDRDDLR